MEPFVVEWAIRRKGVTLETAKDFASYATPDFQLRVYSLAEMWDRYTARIWEL